MHGMDNSILNSSEISRVCDEFESAWLAGERPELNSYLFSVSSSFQESLATALLEVDLEYRRSHGEVPKPADYELCGVETIQLAAQLLKNTRPPALITAASSVSLQEEVFRSTEGRYRLLEPAGAGGTGTVWKAEQLFPVKRKVAVKLLRSDRLSANSIVRFQKERQLLASMKHPHIPAIYDGGEMRGGQPFLVMEFIEGTPITTFCDQRSLGIEDRLKLVISVCRTIHYAHEREIIHRDIKPTNVLMEVCQGKLVPKIIDFGFAKSTEIDQEVSAQMLSSDCGKLIGTLPYISPEQAALTFSAIDRRTDIYSIGALTYELITGTLPLTTPELENQAVWQTLECIRNVDPERPSQRAKRHANWTPAEQRRLATELDWIILKALEKSAVRRYESATMLADDMERFLNRQSVRAKPYAIAYCARKFCKRHRLGIAATGIATVMLVAGAIIGITGLNRLTKEISSPPAQSVTDNISRVELAERQLQTAQNFFKSLTTQRSCITNLHAVPHVDGLHCYFSDSRSAGEYVLEYRRKWEDAPGSVEWEPWTPVPMKLKRRQLRGASSEYCIAFPVEGSFCENTIYQLKIRRMQESCFTDSIEIKTVSSPVLSSPLRKAPRQTLTFGGGQLAAGELRCPGLFRNDETGILTNYLWEVDALPRTTSAKLSPGSLMVTKEGRNMIGVSPQGCLYVVQEEAGRLQNWKCEIRHSFSPQRLACVPSWCDQDSPQGSFAVNKRGQVVNFYWVHEEGHQSHVLEFPHEMVPGSLVVAANQQLVYGVNTKNQLISITRVDGVLRHHVFDLPVEVVPGSLVCYPCQNSENNEGANLYAVDARQRLFRLSRVNGEMRLKIIQDAENVVAGSLVIPADSSTLFGIQGSSTEGTGDVFQIGSHEERPLKLEYKTKIFAGSLVTGGDASNSRLTPSLFGVDTLGSIINFRYLSDEWDIRSVKSASAIPGTLASHPEGEALYAISLEGETLEITRKSDHFVVRNLDESR